MAKGFWDQLRERWVLEEHQPWQQWHQCLRGGLFGQSPTAADSVYCVGPSTKPSVAAGEAVNNLYSLHKGRDETFKPAGEVRFSRVFSSHKALETFLCVCVCVQVEISSGISRSPDSWGEQWSRDVDFLGPKGQEPAGNNFVSSS